MSAWARLDWFVMNGAVSLVLAAGILIGVVAAQTFEDPPPEPVVVTVEIEAPADPAYIVVEYIGEAFTEAAYHERVRAQIERNGFEAICVQHLGTLAREARYLSVNSARQNLVYVTECGRMSTQPDKQSTEDTP